MKFYPANHNDRNRYDIDFFGGDPFEDFFHPFFDESRGMMRTDVREADGTIRMDVDMPGFCKEDIDLSLRDGYLTVSARHTDKEESEGYVRRERSSSCTRTYYVGNVDESAVKATYENGTLKLVFPKESAPESAKKIQIK